MAIEFIKGESESLDFGSGSLSLSSMTVSCLFYRETSGWDTDTRSHIFGKYNNLTNDRGYYIGNGYTTDDGIQAGFSTDGTKYRIVDFADGRGPTAGVWNHLAMTHNATGALTKLWLNGESSFNVRSEPSAISGGINDPAETLYVGRVTAQASDAGYTTGRIAELAVWDTVLSADSLTKLRNGMIPIGIQYANLKFYLSGRSSTAAEIGGAPTENGTPAIVTHPTVFYPPHFVLPHAA